MPPRRHHRRADQTTRGTRSLAPTATLVGMTGLALTAVVSASALLAAVAGSYIAGVGLGVGVATVVWIVSKSTPRLSGGRRRVAGRSRTLDCRRARWNPSVPFGGVPHPPAPADRRTRACPGSRHR